MQVERETERERSMDVNSNRAEAERWLGIAEKLLSARDFLGSKTFAIRSRESDPTLVGPDQILAVADTLLAADLRINDHPNWYAILQLDDQTHDSQLIATQYRRLASLLNPQINRFVLSDQAFSLLSQAWSVLSDSTKKTVFDNELNYQKKETKQEDQQQQLRRSSRSKEKKVIVDDNSKQISDSDISSFWTACPYCYYMYEYPKVYEECSLRCQNCQRAFHGVAIPSPPTIGKGRDAYFCCWTFFPLGFSMSNADFQKNSLGFSNWTPFSPMFNCPSQSFEAQNLNPHVNVVQNPNIATPKNVRKSTAQRVIIDDDDDDEYVGDSDPSDDSSDDWDTSSRKKKKKLTNVKGKGSLNRNAKKSPKKKMKKAEDKVGKSEPMLDQSGNVSRPEPSKNAVAINTRRQTGKAVKELGKLDLNVDLYNEVEEPAPGINQGENQEDGIEGNAFFEGLDEFLSSLPILSVPADENVKAS